MQTILGAGGAVGVELAKALTKYTTDIRLVSRNPKKVNETDTLFPADVFDKTQISKAIEGSEVCYLTVGLPYTTKLWQEKWPVLIKSVVEACIEHNAKLVFFDNVYTIGGDNVKHITENSPISPTSKKGEVRAEVDNYILTAVNEGKLQAIIARSPDFFGEIKQSSLTMNLIYDNLIKNKPAQWFCSADFKHTTGYTPDLAKGTAILGNTLDAFNQVWNLPTDDEALTGREWTALFAEVMAKPNKIQVLPGWALKALGLFVPILGEMYEMKYQYDRDYYFDSTKFKTTFNYSPTSNREAVRQVVEALAK